MTVVNAAWKTDIANLYAGKNVNISTAVTNLVTDLLGRTPLSTEIASYINAVDPSAYATGGYVFLTQSAENVFLSKIFNSTEFQEPNIQNSAYVVKLYHDIMGRAPDAVGQAYWTNKLDAGATRANVANDFLASVEFSLPTGLEASHLLTTAPAVSQLWKSDLQSVINGSTVDLTTAINHAFEALVGRPATTSEFNAAHQAAQSGLASPNSNFVTPAAEADILHYVLGSTALLNSAGSNADFISNLYNNILGRASDTAGAKFWTEQLQKGASRGDIATSFITSNEFAGVTGFNYHSSLLSQVLDVLWQNSPTSWVGNPAQAAYQLKSLMGSSTNWTLVLDFNPQWAAKGNSGGWTEPTLTAFMEALQAAGVSPNQILYHPDGEDVAGWFPNGYTPSPDPNSPNYDVNFYQDYTSALAQWMVTLNAALKADTKLTPNYQLTGLVGEGTYLPKDFETYNDFANAFSTLKVNPAPKLWFTGDWKGSNTLPPPTGNPTPAGDPTSGYFVQLYDYYWTLGNNTYLKDQYFVQNNGSTLGVRLPTNPDDATNAGHELLTTLGGLTTSGGVINPDLFSNTSRTVLTLNFTGQLSDGPVFGPYIPGNAGVTGLWGLDSTYSLLSALQTQAKILSSANPAPDIAIWSIEDALNTFYPVLPINPTTFTVPKPASTIHFQGALENNPKIFTPTNGGVISLNLQINDKNMKAIGLVPIYDKLGDLLASDGHLVSPSEPGYGQLALQQASQKGLWQDVSSIVTSSHPSTTLNWSVNPASSYVLVVQDESGQIQTSVGHNSLGNSWLANGLGADSGKFGIQLSGWNPVTGASFDDAVLKINGLQSVNASGAYPTVNVLWEDYASWDSITASQLANLISYGVKNGDGSVTYPNAGLEFIVSGVGPLSKGSPIAPSHFDSTGKTTATAFANTPTGLADFISSISDQVFKLTGGAVKWATQGGTGSVSYHPDTTTYYTYTDPNKVVHSNLDYSTDWAGYTIPETNETFSPDISNAYMSYVDYTLYLNKTLNGYLTQNGQHLQGFSQLVYETERTYPDDPDNAPKGLWEQTLFNNLKTYPGNLALLPNGQPIWYGPIKLAGTSEAISNWQAGPTNGWGADNYLAQIYDLAANVPTGDPDTSDYPYTGWNNAIFSTLKQSGAVTPTSVAQAFADFLANPSAGEPNAPYNKTGAYNPKMAEYNVNRLISPQSDVTHPSTSYTPNASFIFSYGPGKIDNQDHTQDNPLSNQPIFQYGEFDSQGNTPTANAYRWNANDFATFLAEFKTDLTKNLQTIATDAGVQNSFSNPSTSTPSLGVWGGERALDAWVGFLS